jgi:hypothetical protein
VTIAPNGAESRVLTLQWLRPDGSLEIVVGIAIFAYRDKEDAFAGERRVEIRI